MLLSLGLLFIAALFLYCIVHLWKKSGNPDALQLRGIWFGWVGMDLLVSVCTILFCSAWHTIITPLALEQIPQAAIVTEYILFSSVSVIYSAFSFASGNPPIVSLCVSFAFLGWLWS